MTKPITANPDPPKRVKKAASTLGDDNSTRAEKSAAGKILKAWEDKTK